jgi:hypothetical protein
MRIQWWEGSGIKRSRKITLRFSSRVDFCVLVYGDRYSDAVENLPEWYDGFLNERNETDGNQVLVCRKFQSVKGGV